VPEWCGWFAGEADRILCAATGRWSKSKSADHAPRSRREKTMVSLVVLAVSFVLLRLLGLFGVARLASAREAARAALAVMFLFTGSMHFSGLKHDFAAMIPDPFPNGLWVVYLTGAFEIAGGIGLLVPWTRTVASRCLVLLLVVMFTANVNAVLNDIPLGGDAPMPLWLRAPMQLLYIAVTWWVATRTAPLRAEGRTTRPSRRDRAAAPEVTSTA
jgi:uncharacterized membrane protein